MIGKLLCNEGVNAGLGLALGVTTMVLVANGPGPLSLDRISSRALSNPVPRREPASACNVPTPTPRSRIAA